MENKRLGKLLTIIGLLMAIAPLIIVSALLFFYGIYIDVRIEQILFVIGIAIAIFGEYLNRK